MDYVYKKVENFSTAETIKYLETITGNFYFINYVSSNKPLSFKILDKTILVQGNANNKDLAEKVFQAIIQDKDDNFLESMNFEYRKTHVGIKKVKVPPSRFFTNSKNSCAIDSIYSILFFAKSGYFINKIISSDVENTNFPRWYNSENIKILAEGVRIRTLQMYNEADYTNMNQIQQFLGNFSKERCYDIKAVYELWNSLCLLFKDLSVNVRTNYEKLIGNDPINYYTFVDKVEDVEEWPDHIVYVNDVITKKHDFSNLAVNGYTLYGVIYWMDNHYTSCVKIFDVWYDYNDLNGRFNKTERNVLKQTNEKITMMFYIKNTD